MKVTLVNVLEFDPIREYLSDHTKRTSTAYPPMGLLTLAAVLEAKGHVVKVIDFANLILRGEIALNDRFFDNAAEYIASTAPDVAGFSSRCDNYLQSLQIARELRRAAGRVPIIFGGPQATITDSITLERFPFVDCVVRHEAEHSLPKLLEALGENRSLADIAGIVYREEGRIIRNADPPLILELDEIPIPDFNHFPIGSLETMPIEVGRGCPFGCTFCITNRYFNRRYRLKSADRIIDEVLLLQQKYGFTSFGFIHDMLTASRPLVLQLCNRIKERAAKFEWTCSARTDCVDRELLDLMVDAGCRGIYFGIETGSPRMQKIVNKNLKLNEVFPVIDLCANLGLSVTASFITGFPEEKVEDVEDTLRMMLQLTPKVQNLQLHLYSPTPGTPLTDKFADRLVYTGYISDFGFSTRLSAADEELVKANPDLFTNYFQIIPLFLDLDEINGLDAFGYSMRLFKHFFFYLLHEPNAPTLLFVWQGLKRWVTRNNIEWNVEELNNRLWQHMERYLKSFIHDPYYSELLAEAFNLDVALLRLGDEAAKMTKRGESMLQGKKNFFIVESELKAVRLQTPVVCMETRFNIAEMIEALRTRQYVRPANYGQPRKLGIFTVKSPRNKGLKLAFVQLDPVTEAILKACTKELTTAELLEHVTHSLCPGERKSGNLLHQTRYAIQRLIRMQLLEPIEPGVEDAYCPKAIVLDRTEVAPQPVMPPVDITTEARI